MDAKILLSKDFCECDAIMYVASRYSTTPEKVLMHYFVQTGMVRAYNMVVDDEYELAPNEIALFSDLGVQPSAVEIK